MIKLYGKDDFKRGFIVTGHADYAEEGMDIVCSAVSAITQTALVGLMEFCHERAFDWSQRLGFLEVTINEPTLESEIIVETMVLGLRQVAKQYKENVQFT